MLNKVCYCSITSDYISDNTLQCDSENTTQMRARLSAISNFTTSHLLSILQNWTTHTAKIIVDGQVLTVTSVYFLSNDTTPVLTSPSPSDTTPVLTSPSPSDTTPVLTSPSSSDTTPVLTSDNPNQTSNYETNRKNVKNVVILLTAIGSASGFLLFLCACCIIISVRILKKLKSKRHNKLKPKFVVNTISNNFVITKYIENIKC